MSQNPRVIAPGSRIRLDLEILLEDGTVALSSFGEEPLEVTVGDGTLAAGLEELLLGLPAGADERFLAEGADLYGPRDTDNVHWLPLSNFDEGMRLETGQVIAFETPGGQETAGTILALERDRARVDFNHPLANRSLQIRARIHSVQSPGDPDA